MALILHLETATVVCSVALSENGMLIEQQTIANDKYAHGEQLTLLIDGVMRAADKSYAQLNAISVSMGPGSYTGLRIGLSTAKGLCYALNIPLVGIGTLDAMLHLARKKHATKTLCALLDARRMEVYSKISLTDGSVVKTVSADVIDSTTYSEFDSFVAFGDGAEKLREIWKDRSVEFDTELLCEASGQVELAFEAYQHNHFENLAYSEPIYLKDFGGMPLTT